MARPIKPVDEKLIEKLAAINCTSEEIASMVGVHKRTLERRYAAIIEKGRSGGRTSLKRKMFDMAVNGHPTMLIWLSKQMLGYTDKVEERTTSEQVVTYKSEWANHGTSQVLPDTGAETGPVLSASSPASVPQ